MEPKCKFCDTEISKHEAGSDTDKCVAKAQGWSVIKQTNYPSRIAEAIGCEPEVILRSSVHREDCYHLAGKLMSEVSAYKPSTDLNHAIELWNEEWYMFCSTQNSNKPEVKTWGIVEYTASNSFFGEINPMNLTQVSKAPTLALALTRAYLIDQMKEDNND